METTTVITYDGPYLHVLLRDVLPPDWEDVRRELEREIECGAAEGNHRDRAFLRCLTDGPRSSRSAGPAPSDRRSHNDLVVRRSATPTPRPVALGSRT